MSKRTFFLTIILIIIISVPIYFFMQKPRTAGRVLGSSINAFYSKKIVRFGKPPAKNTGVKDPLIYADYAVLMDDSSKYPLYKKGSDAVVPIASITKVMTSIVSMDLYQMSDVITVPDGAAKISGSQIDLQRDEKITVENLLYGLMMNSGNDAAESLASSKVTKEEFVNLMNVKAKDIGMNGTEFKDPAGLDDSGHSTAFDIAILFSYAIKNEKFKEFIGTPEKEIFSVDGTISHKLKNSNRLTTNEIPFDGVIGGKTGYTEEAGHGLVCAAEHEGTTLISVILKTHSSANEASAQETKKLLSWGFDSFTFYK